MPNLRLAFACALAATAACGGGGSIDVHDLGDKLASADCDYYVRCGVFTNAADCMALINGSLDPQLLADVDAGKIHYDGGAASDCLDSISGLSCNPGDQDNRVTPQSCTDAFQGTVADGGDCFISDECVSLNCTIPTCSMACCVGTCGPADPAPVAIGQSCASAPCVDGAYCDQTGTCAALLPADSACQGNFECGYGLLCLGTPGTCQTPHDAGEDCITGSSQPDCGITGVICDTTTNKCTHYLAPGATCDPQNPLCEPLMTCDATTNTCTGYPALGEACPAGICAQGSYCDQTTTMCTAPQANGQTCASNNECQSDYCDSTSGQCADPLICN